MGHYDWDQWSVNPLRQISEPPLPECSPDRTYVPTSFRHRVMQWFIAHPAQVTQELRPPFNSSPIGSGGPLSKRIPSTLFSSVPSVMSPNLPTSATQDFFSHSLFPRRPWSHIAIDFVTDLPSSRNYTTILMVIDRFSKACHLIPHK